MCRLSTPRIIWNTRRQHAIHKQTIESRSIQNEFIAKFIQIDFHLSSVHRACVCACNDRKIVVPSPSRSFGFVVQIDIEEGTKKSSWKCADFYCEILTSMYAMQQQAHSDDSTIRTCGSIYLHRHMRSICIHICWVLVAFFLLLLPILKCYTILERQTNRSIFLFALCIAHKHTHNTHAASTHP